MKTFKTKLIVLTFAVFAAVAPITAKAETLICSKFEFFNAQALNAFDGFSEEKKVSDWSPERPLPHDLGKIVIAIPKSEVSESFGCVHQANRLVPGVKEAILEGSSAIGAEPEQKNKIVIGKFSGGSLFGPVMTDIRYVRSPSVTVQVIITDNPEPIRSIRAIERFYDLPLGYCEQNDNCGVEHGEK